MKARVKLVDGMMFVGESGSGHAVVMDGAPEYGGRNLGIRPMEMLLLGLGGCTAFDVVQILRKGREQVSDCEVDVTAERAETDPKVFTRIHLEYRVAGKDLAPAKVERAIQLSKEKYCSASIMLGAVAEITHSWTSVDEAAEPAAAAS
ncbi:OsmC family protein [Microvirga splendida]|uniref:OsmC family protein n=1 Tax=Microvirga splendida TaxID=2795727 RepID=A0ABS0Y179_9HYPH|nr:OsmC family protein [Microvirga splendida]MBJ6125688.1 OsmC family protein [Microvirga splendida]